MDADERAAWIFFLWVLSLGTAIWLTASAASGWEYGGVRFSPMFLFPVAFVPSFFAWLFRVTYLAGKRR